MPKRYTARPLPPYRYRSGSTPHPIRDPAGHSYGKESAPRYIDQDDWAHCEQYLFAVDLLNDGYYWEAHEELEGLWLGTGRDSPAGRFLQGLIQAAAALLKLEAGKVQSAARLVDAAAAKLLEPGGTFLGIDGAALTAELRAKLRTGDSTPPAIDLSSLE